MVTDWCCSALIRIICLLVYIGVFIIPGGDGRAAEGGSVPEERSVPSTVLD